MTAHRDLAAVAIATGIAPVHLLQTPEVLEEMFDIINERGGGG